MQALQSRSLFRRERERFANNVRIKGFKTVPNNIQFLNVFRIKGFGEIS